MADLYTPADELLQELARNRAADGAAYRGTIETPYPNSPPPPGAAAAGTVAEDAATVVKKPNVLSRMASGTGALAANAALRAAPLVGGFVGGSGLTKDAAGVAATPGSTFTGANKDIPADYTDAQRAQVTPQAVAQTPDNYLKRSRDGIISSVRNASMSNLMDSANALPGAGGAIGAIGNIAQNGGRLARLGAGLIGEMPMLEKIGQGIGQGAVATGFIQPPTGPISQAAAKTNPVEKRVADVIDKMNGNPSTVPGLTGVTQQPTSVNGVSQLTGGQFKSPMFTDDPARAAAEYGSKKNSLFSVVPSTAAADRAYLQGAFLKHLNSGDLDRAEATASSPEEQAALGTAYTQRRQAQAQAAQIAPIQRRIQEELDRSPRERALDEDPRTRLFGRTQKGGSPDNTAGLLQAMSALQQGQKSGDPGKAGADVLAAMNNNQAAKTNIEGQKIAQQGQQVTQQGLLQMQALRNELVKETDPSKREIILENMRGVLGKDKVAPPDKFAVIDGPDGTPDMMGNVKPTKVAMNTSTGEILNGRAKAAAAPPSKAEIIKNAQAALAAGKIKKEAIIADSLRTYGFDPFK